MKKVLGIAILFSGGLSFTAVAQSSDTHFRIPNARCSKATFGSVGSATASGPKAAENCAIAAIADFVNRSGMTFTANAHSNPDFKLDHHFYTIWPAYKNFKEVQKVNEVDDIMVKFNNFQAELKKPDINGGTVFWFEGTATINFETKVNQTRCSIANVSSWTISGEAEEPFCREISLNFSNSNTVIVSSGDILADYLMKH